jgi:hypothetical protein
MFDVKTSLPVLKQCWQVQDVNQMGIVSNFIIYILSLTIDDFSWGAVRRG